MPRKKKTRRVLQEPKFKGFRIFGKRANAESINLFVEEYEAIRLLDHEGLKQEAAAVKMNISRPTLTRIYETARQKIAQSITEGLNLRIAGGNYSLVS